jgi:hypothetical protein
VNVICISFAKFLLFIKEKRVNAVMSIGKNFAKNHKNDKIIKSMLTT